MQRLRGTSRRFLKSAACVCVDRARSQVVSQSLDIQEYPGKKMERYRVDRIIGEGCFGKAVLCARITDDKVRRGNALHFC